MTRDEKWLLEEKYGGTPTSEFERDKKRLSHGEPVAYVIGFQPFLGLRIALDSKPLIPRPETEWWTGELTRELRTRFDDAPFTLLDLCAGSGAIGLSILKEFPNAEVSFGEIDPAHEATIRKSIEMNGLDASRASIGIGNLFEPFKEMRFDVVATNPPYVPEGRTLEESVTNHEPDLALFGGEDGLSLIRRIAADVSTYLNARGALWLECDSEHAEKALALMRESGAKEAALRTDQYGRPRVIVAYF